MKHEIDSKTLKMLTDLKKKLLLYGDRIIVINDFTYTKELVTVRTFFFSKRQVEKIYLTNIIINMVSQNNVYIGSVNPKDAVSLFLFHDLYTLRSNWKELTNQLAFFGFKIVPIKNQDQH